MRATARSAATMSPFLFTPIGDAGGTLEVRSSIDSRTLADLVRGELPRVHPSLRLVDVTLQTVARRQYAAARASACRAVGFLRGAGPRAGRGRTLRRLELRRRAPNARDRHSPHARRAAVPPSSARSSAASRWRWRPESPPVLPEASTSRGSCGRCCSRSSP